MSTSPNDRTGRQAKIDAAAPRTGRGRSLLIPILAVLVVLGIVGGVWYGTRGGDETNASSTGASTGGGAAPRGATGPTGGILVTSTPKSGAPTFDVYEDFQCPNCQSAEQAVGPTIKKMASDGEAKVVYHMKSFMDGNLQNDSSTRAALAASCAADQGKFQAFHDAVYASQTPEGQGFTDAKLKEFASSAGLSGDALSSWESCYGAKKYSTYVKSVEDTTNEAGVRSTPTFKVNGKDLDLSKVQDPAGFRQAVLSAGGASS